ncbi:hypothetical protein CK498_02055 [Halomonas salipaludis]|uniref:Uncharacterized protein n=1 Tax=Halomonas salipaludis TaxID=2032625 RepID=A0A2A2F3S3_9GAMM|nr:hypothetical protein CK498_02055 [Halomonas salipaludis]
MFIVLSGDLAEVADDGLVLVTAAALGFVLARSHLDNTIRERCAFRLPGKGVKGRAPLDVLATAAQLAGALSADRTPAGADILVERVLASGFHAAFLRCCQ